MGSCNNFARQACALVRFSTLNMYVTTNRRNARKVLRYGVADLAGTCKYWVNIVALEYCDHLVGAIGELIRHSVPESNTAKSP